MSHMSKNPLQNYNKIQRRIIHGNLRHEDERKCVGGDRNITTYGGFSEWTYR